MPSSTDEQILNAGDVLCRKLSLYVSPDDGDPVEALVTAIREAAEELENVRFEAETESDPYGGFDSHFITITGSTTGELRGRCRRKYAENEERVRDNRIRAARQTLAREGIRVSEGAT
jgi:hypothetical protein